MADVRRRGPAPARRRGLAAALSAVVLAPLLAGCFAEPSPQEAVRDFLVGWQSGDFAKAAARTDGDHKTVEKALSQVGPQLDATSFRFRLTSLDQNGDSARAVYHATVDLGENAPPWLYDGRLDLRLIGNLWKVRWSPSAIHPKLGPGQRLAVVNEVEPRAPVLDSRGNTLLTEATVYVAGAIPSGLSNPEEVGARLAKATGFAEDRILGQIRSAPPNEFVKLATFGKTKYAELSGKLAAIPGIEIRQEPMPIAAKAPTEIVGAVSAPTAETAAQLGGPAEAGDTVGRSGLQKVYQDQLAGSTSTEVVALDQNGRKVGELAKWPAKPNAPVHTTIDSAVQQRAEEAVAGAGPVVMVAVHAPTGKVLAVADEGLNQVRNGLAGRYPPGTAFSIVSTSALVRSGVGTGLKVPCPAERRVGEATFQQAGASANEAPSLRENFLRGCVTAYAALARRVSPGVLAEEAQRFGIGGDWSLPLQTYTGSLPDMTRESQQAEVMTGESVRVSPLGMALIAASVSTGGWRPPQLVVDKTKPEAVPRARLLDPDALRALRKLMRDSVKRDTRFLGIDGLSGVSSTVGYTEKGQRREGSWFVGYQDEIAVAVFAQNVGGDSATEVAARFFRSLS
ncbi:penicillin-binding protein [Bailinhaonella thermotolerans]|uniref:Penicillin-binding protein n=1 Tax=Bailinhaonella thermotolerans TaxID=1070861 RepID=A0A3A4ANK5_9ACTN|nr:penicillin-binding protein [Bailinhaonella thermotolerans]